MFKYSHFTPINLTQLTKYFQKKNKYLLIKMCVSITKLLIVQSTFLISANIVFKIIVIILIIHCLTLLK